MMTPTEDVAPVTPPDSVPPHITELHKMVSELHAFAGKIDRLLGAIESELPFSLEQLPGIIRTGLPFLLSAMPADVARDLIGK